MNTRGGHIKRVLNKFSNLTLKENYFCYFKGREVEVVKWQSHISTEWQMKSDDRIAAETNVPSTLPGKIRLTRNEGWLRQWSSRLPLRPSRTETPIGWGGRGNVEDDAGLSVRPGRTDGQH